MINCKQLSTISNLLVLSSLYYITLLNVFHLWCLEGALIQQVKG